MCDKCPEQLDAYSLNAASAEDLASLDAETRQLVARRDAVLGPAYRLFYSRPVHPVRALGTKLWDASGEVLLDAYNNVPCVGHGNPRVVEAVSRQLSGVSTHTRYIQRQVIDYAEDLLSTFDPQLDHVMLTCTGSEANDLAIRLARTVTGNTGVIVSEFAYHGATVEVASWSPAIGNGVPIGQDVRLVPPPDAFRHPGVDMGQWLAAQVQRQIDDMNRHGVGLAAFVADSLFSSDGIHTEPANLLQPVVDVVHRAGGLFVADEVQAGFARTGSRMWGHQRAGIVPDVATMGKPMGNGLPIAAVVAQADLMHEFGTRVPYFNTFGGNTACVAAAQAVLDVIREEDLLGNVRDRGRDMVAGMTAILRGVGRVVDVRGAGLYLGVEFCHPDDAMTPDPTTTVALVNQMREEGVLISVAGPYSNCLKIRPPLVFDAADVDLFLSAFDRSVSKVVPR